MRYFGLMFANNSMSLFWGILYRYNQAEYTAMAMENFLQELSLQKYINLLTGQGYTDEEDLFMINEKDLDSVHIVDVNDRNTILNAG